MPSLIDPLPGKRPDAVPAGLPASGFTPDTEVLTEIGWLTAGDLHEHARDGPAIRVAQYRPESAAIEFVPPIVTAMAYTGPLLSIRTKRKIDLLLPPGHPCLLGELYKESTRVVAAADYLRNHHQLHAGYYAGGRTKLDPAQVAWLAAVQADGCVRQQSAISFGFSKQRKIDRLVATMEQLGVRYSEHAPNVAYGEKARFWIGPEKNREFLVWSFGLLGQGKLFGPWLLDLDRATLDCFVEETLNWDGNVGPRDRYFTVESCNADWVQILWTLSGTRARDITFKRPIPNPKHRQVHTVCLSRGERAHSMTTNLIRKVVPWDGPLHAVVVPSGFVLVRRDGKVSITGGGFMADGRPRRRARGTVAGAL